MRLVKGDGRVLLRFVRSALRLRRILEHELVELGLSPLQVELLNAIREENRASHALLARRMQVKRQAIHVALAELAEEELVEREGDQEDQRSWLWGLTNEGELRLDAALDVLAAAENRYFRDTTDEHRLFAAMVIEAALEEVDRQERMSWFPLAVLR